MQPILVNYILLGLKNIYAYIYIYNFENTSNEQLF